MTVNMSITQLLDVRVFVSERLTAAADEIFGVFERTIVKYEEEVSRSQQEIERQRRLLDVLLKHNAEPSQPACGTEPLPDTHPCEAEWNSCFDIEDPAAPPIKEEQQEFGSTKEEEQLQELKDSNIIQFILPPSSPCAKNDPASAPNQNDMEHQPFHGVEDRGENGGPLSHLTQSKPKTIQMANRPPSCGPARLPPGAPYSGPGRSNHCCHLCEKTFSYKQHLLNHVHRVHSKDTEISCGVCGKMLESSDSLPAHLKSHMSTRVCHVCGKHCISSSAMAEHMATHTGVKAHRCPVCGKECSRKGDMKIHMRIHTGEKPFCCPFCGKGFTHSGHLKKHMRSHTGERPYQCEVCGRDFTQSIHLKHHLKTHARP